MNQVALTDIIKGTPIAWDSLGERLITIRPNLYTVLIQCFESFSITNYLLILIAFLVITRMVALQFQNRYFAVIVENSFSVIIVLIAILANTCAILIKPFIFITIFIGL